MTLSIGELQRENVRLTNEVASLKRQLETYEVQYERLQLSHTQLRADSHALELLCTRQSNEIRGYIEQDVVAGGKYRAKLEAAAAELRLVTKARLTSGCGCPIGVCLNYGSDVLAGACWVQWAEAYVMKRQGEVTIDALRTQASHPARIAAANRKRENDGTVSRSTHAEGDKQE